MRLLKIISFSFVFCVIAQTDALSQSVITDSLKKFVLSESDKLYWKEIYTDDFIQYTGFFSEEPSDKSIIYTRLINGANDTIYINSQFGRWGRSECLLRDNNSYLIRGVDLHSDSSSSTILRKKFDYESQNWEICNIYNDGIFYSGSVYDTKRNFFYSISEENNFSEDALMTKVCFFILMLVVVYTVIPWWIYEECEIWTTIRSVAGFLVSLGLSIFLDLCVVKELFLPLLCLALTAFVYLIPWNNKIIKTTTQVVCVGVIIVFFVYNQFYRISDCIKLSDGYELNISWKRGTCLIKRAYIKKMLSDMIPVNVSYCDTEEYTLYVSKYEFSMGNLDVVSSNALYWLTGLSKRPMYELSFRESQVILENLSNLTGLNFDILSFNEWLSIVKFKKHSPNNLEFSKVTKGDVSEEGLVNILSNMPEFTSNYYSADYSLSLAADTMFRSYNSIIVAGSVKKCTDSTNISIVNKYFRNGLAGFRFVFRPDKIGARKYCINGFIRSDRIYLGLPKKIRLVSVDGHRIEDLASYESFEELLIESRLRPRKIEAIDLSNNNTFVFIQPEGLEYYDFEPLFSFVRSVK